MRFNMRLSNTEKDAINTQSFTMRVSPQLDFGEEYKTQQIMQPVVHPRASTRKSPCPLQQHDFLPVINTASHFNPASCY